LSMIPPDASIITTDKIAAQISNRSHIQMLDESKNVDPSMYQYILIDNSNPGWRNSKSRNDEIEISAASNGCLIISKDSFATLYQCP
jgi:hypothetical protein